MSQILVYRDSNLVQASVSLPKYLRTHARERGISLSGTLREVLKKDYEEVQARATASNSHPGPINTTPNVEAIDDS